MLSTFATPIPVQVNKSAVDAVFDGGEPGSGEGVVIAISETLPGWFTDGMTHFLVVAKGGAVGWVNAKYCKFPGLVK